MLCHVHANKFCLLFWEKEEEYNICSILFLLANQNDNVCKRNFGNERINYEKKEEKEL